MEQLKPRWWQLYSLIIFWIALLWLVNFWHATEQLHEMAQVGITFCCFGAFNMWLALNSPALERWEQARRAASEGKAAAISERQARYRWSIRRRDLTSSHNH